MDDLRIGDLARATDTRVETIRWYEKQGLIPSPSRTSSNYRAYGEEALARLSFIRRARDLGFPLDRVRALLRLASDETGDCASVDVLAQQHLDEIDRKIADLSALRAELSGLLASCKGGTIGKCQVIDALAPRGLSVSHRSARSCPELLR